MKRTAKKKSSKTKTTTKTFGNDGQGWLKLNHQKLYLEVIDQNPIAWCLLTMVAERAWRGPGKNKHGCVAGEAFVGDYEDRNWTRKQYRIALDQLKSMGLIDFRATNRGTIARLESTYIFDINIENGSVTERTLGPSEGHQGAIKGPSEGQLRANEGPSEGHQGATNKKLRSEEVKTGRNQKDNTTNNGADAQPGGGGVLPPAGAGEALPDTGGDYIPQTPDQKAIELGQFLPKFCKKLGGLNQLPVFTQATTEEAIEYFERNNTYEPWDVAAMCVLGMKAARETVAPAEGVDPYFWCRRFANKPNRIFTRANDGDLILAKIQNELKYAPDVEHDEEWAVNLFNSELAAVARQ